VFFAEFFETDATEKRPFLKPSRQVSHYMLQRSRQSKSILQNCGKRDMENVCSR